MDGMNHLCHCCGGPLEASQKLLYLACMMGEPEPEQPEEHPQSEWKQECENDSKAIRDL